ncbi:MAG: ATP-binding protein [Candidatus Omnitrophota bacterium]|jgi:heavy metal sensor kinase
MLLRSIRFRIVLWYMGLLTLTLLVFSCLVYENFKKAMYDDLDDLLNSKADGIANAITTYWEIEEMRQGNGISENLFHADSANFLAMASNWAMERSKDPNLMSIFVQILDPLGNKLITSKNLPNINKLSEHDFQHILAGEDSFDTIGGSSATGSAMKFRVYTKPVIKDGKAVYIIQVASAQGLIYVALHGLRIMLFVLLPITVIVTGIAGAFLARLTLRPVDHMIGTLKKITAENLKLRIHIPDTKDEVKRLADTFNDMIERLDKSFTSQHEFIQDVSHELRTPLTILKGELEVTLKKLRSPEEYEEVLKSSLEEIGKMSRVIEDLLVLARFDNNQVALEIRRVDLGNVLNHVMEDMKILAEQKDIETSLSRQENLMLDGDEDQLRRLFVNLFDNAIKYTSRKGKVVVMAHKAGSDIKIVVSDTGIGIPEDELPYIFDRFYQVARARRSNHGFGLGLSIAKSIVESHRGAISVSSQISQGATFTVSLPMSYPV